MANFPYDWYWKKDDGTIYSSVSQQSYPPDTPSDEFKKFTDGGNVPTRWPEDDNGKQTDQSLLDVISVYGLYLDQKAMLLSYAAAKRYEAETNGIVVNKMEVETDRQSQSMIIAAYLAATRDPTISFRWKQADGSWIVLPASDVVDLAMKVLTHVEKCFTSEANVYPLVQSGVANTTALIDSAFTPEAIDAITIATDTTSGAETVGTGTAGANAARVQAAKK